MPILKHNMQDKDKLRSSEEYVKKYHEDKSLTVIYYSNWFRNFPGNISDIMFPCEVLIKDHSQKYGIPYSINGTITYF